jgi:hypothetical protein
MQDFWADVHSLWGQRREPQQLYDGRFHRHKPRAAAVATLAQEGRGPPCGQMARCPVGQRGR